MQGFGPGTNPSVLLVFFLVQKRDFSKTSFPPRREPHFQRSRPRFFWFFMTCFYCFFGMSFLSCLSKMLSFICKMQHFRGLRRLRFMSKNLIFSLKSRGKLTSGNSIIFMVFSWNLHHSHTGAMILGGSEAKKTAKIVFFCVCFLGMFFSILGSFFA